MTYQIINLTIPNLQNLKLATEIYKPDKEGKLPVVFLFHGFTGYKEDAGLVDIAKRLAEQGIVSVRFTSSGFGDSEGSIEDYRFSQYRTDAQCVFDTITRYPYVNPALVGVYGNSIGGKLAILFCQDNPSVKAVCITSAPVTFVGTEYEAYLAQWKERGYFEKVSGRDGRRVRIPYAYVTDVDSPAHDVLSAASRLHTPIALVVAGERDTEVPQQETKKVFDALSCPKKFLLLPDMVHRYGKIPDMIPMVSAPVVEFFVANLQRPSYL